MERRGRVQWTMALFLVALMFTAIGATIVREIHFIFMRPCIQSYCEAACKARFGAKLVGGVCYKGRDAEFCMCYTSNYG